MEITTWISGNLSRKICSALGIQVESWPIMKPKAKLGLVICRTDRKAVSAWESTSAGVTQEYPSRGGQFDTTRAPGEKRSADFMLEVADLATQ